MLWAARLQLDLPGERCSLWKTQRSWLAAYRKEVAACSERLLQVNVRPGHESPAQHHLHVRGCRQFLFWMVTGSVFCQCNSVSLHPAERTKGEWGWLRISGSTKQTAMWKRDPSLTTTSSAPTIQRLGRTRPWRWRSSQGRSCQRSGSSSSGKHTESVQGSSSSYDFNAVTNCHWLTRVCRITRSVWELLTT